MNEIKTEDFFKGPEILPKGKYMEIVVKLKFLDDAIIRSNDAEEVLTYNYKELGNRFVIPWRKVKGKLRRLVMEKQRELGISEYVPQQGDLKGKKTFCHLKDNLCMECPSCYIFGGTGETSGAKVSYNILARVLGESFISVEETKGIMPYTANAVDERKHTTGQALMNILTVPVETEFLGVITLRDPCPEVVTIVVDNLNRLSRLGARTVEWGKVRTEIVGYKKSDRETLCAIDLVKANGEKKDISENLEKMDLSESPKIEKAYKDLDKSVKELIKELK